MKQELIFSEQLEQLLQANWTKFIDKTKFMASVLADARNKKFREVKTDNMPDNHVKIVITKFAILDSSFEVWAEFTVPRKEGVIIGTHIYHLSLNGTLSLKESLGTIFVPETEP